MGRRRRSKRPKTPKEPANFYDSHEWRSLRRGVLLRDKSTCQYCHQPAVTADHVIARKRGGPDSDINLAGVCRSCNALVGSKHFLSIEEKRQYVREAKRLPMTFSERIAARRSEQQLN